MPDPTELVLTGAFAAAVVVFLIATGLRARSVRGHVTVTVGAETPGRVTASHYQSIDLFVAALVFLIFAGLVLASLQSPEKPASALNVETLLINIGFQFLMAGFVTAIVIRRVQISTWLGLRWPAWPWAFLLAPASLLFMWLLLRGLQLTGYIEWMESLGIETTQETVKLLQESDDPVVLGLMAFAAVIAAPLCEEVVFRGYFYPVLKKFGGMFPAAICSALVFAAAHGNLTALLPLFIFGGVLVFLYEKTGSIWAPIAAHFCFNGSTVALQIAARYYEIPLGSIW